MLRFVFITHGSTGDIVPVIRLAEAAVSRGNRATLFASEHWREAVESRGIELVSIPPFGSQEELSDLMRGYSSIRNPVKLLESMYRHLDTWQDDILPELSRALGRADVFCYSYLFPIYQSLAEARGVPTVSLHFCPNTFFSPLHPPDNLPQLPSFFPGKLRKFWNVHLTSVGDRFVTGKINRTLSRKDQNLSRWLRSPADYSIILTPPELHRGESKELPESTYFSGFVAGGFSAGDARADQAIEEAPLVNFGSVTTAAMENEFRDLYQCWPSDQPLVIQRGWFDPPKPPDGSRIRIIDPAPHTSVFPQASTIIHHGGAGTTTSAFLAGRPQIVIPHFADQPFWARTVKSLGCGDSLKHRGWGKRLWKKIRSLRGNPSFRNNAEAFAKHQRGRDGAQEAINAIESWIANRS